MLPEKIGPYTIEALLNKGGMSTLYLATDPDTKEPVTIKVLSQKHLSNPDVVRRFLKEAEIISMTDHPNIIKMYSHGEWEGGLYISMEYIEGISLRKYILKQPISLKRALGIIIDIAYALCHLHTHGVIHRDLKPENILITANGTVKVIDFGIAQLLTEQKTQDQQAKPQLIGTPIYISPEQKDHPESASFPSDIYSLGIIAYETILGKLSHGHIHLSLMPAGIQPILHRCLQPLPENRYQDVVDFITDLSTYLNSSAVEKERQVGDKLSELSEDLHQMQDTLHPPPPNWPGHEIGLYTSPQIRSINDYYDFFILPNNTYCVIIGRSVDQGASSYVTTAYLKGMMQSLHNISSNPKEMGVSLNQLIYNSPIGPIHDLNLVMLMPEKNKVTYISLGEGTLWLISEKPKKGSSQNIPLGVESNIEITETEHEWLIGDVIFLNTFNPSTDLINALTDNIAFPPQKQVENINRQIRITSSGQEENYPTTLISIKRI